MEKQRQRRQGKSFVVARAVYAGVSSSAAAAGLAALGARAGAVAPTWRSAFLQPKLASCTGRRSASKSSRRDPRRSGAASDSIHRGYTGVSHAGFKLGLGVAVGSAVAASEAARPSRAGQCHAAAGAEVGTPAASSTARADAVWEREQVRQLEEQAHWLRDEAASMEASLATDRRQRFWQSLQEHMHLRGAAPSVELGVSAQDLQWGLQEVLGVDLTVEEADQLVALYDVDGDGAFNFHEFSEAHAHLHEALNTIRRAKEKAAHGRRDRIRSAQAASKSDSSRLPEELIDITPSVKVLAMLAYVIPCLDICRHFATAATEAAVGEVALDIFVVLQPLLLLSMTVLGCRWTLPQLMRFNLHQAFTLDLVITASQLFLTPRGWFNLGLLGLCGEAELEGLSGLCFIAFMGCVAYSCAATSLGVLPDQIPVVSPAARRALGSIHKPNFDKDTRARQKEGAHEKQTRRSKWHPLHSIINFLVCFTAALVYVGLLSGYWSMTAAGLYKYWNYSACTEAFPSIMALPFP